MTHTTLVTFPHTIYQKSFTLTFLLAYLEVTKRVKSVLNGYLHFYLHISALSVCFLCHSGELAYAIHEGTFLFVCFFILKCAYIVQRKWISLMWAYWCNRSEL